MNNDEKVRELHGELHELANELRTHAGEVDDPKCAALCETSAEVVHGLETAFDHFLNKSEEAWQE